MKTLLILFALVCTGCTNMGNLQKFLDKLPATAVGDAKQTFTSPLWSEAITAANVAVDDNGLMDVGEVSATLTIPLWGVVSSFSIGQFKQIPTAKQRAAASAEKAAKAELAEARAATRAADAKAAADARADEAALIRKASLRQPESRPVGTRPDGVTPATRGP